MRVVSRYLVIEHVQPFFLGLAVILFVLITNFLAESLDLLLSKGVARGAILEVFLLSLGWMMALAVPMAVLVATLMAFGRLSGDQEILALRAAGVSPRRIIQPILIAALGVALLLVAYNEWALPATNHRLANLLFEIHRRQPTLGLEEGVFLNSFPGYSILVDEIDDQKGILKEVTIYESLADGGVRTVRAARGKMSWSEDGSILTLELEDGEIHESPPEDPAAYSRVAFADMSMFLRRTVTSDASGSRRSRGDREMGSRDMMAQVRELEEERKECRNRARLLLQEEIARLAADPGAEEGGPGPLARHRQLVRAVRNEANTEAACVRRMNRFRVEIQKKFAIPAACLVFVLVGAPLGIRAHRGGIGIAVGISVLFFLTHYLFLVGGENLADRGLIPPALAMWGGNLAVGSVGLWALRRTERDMPLLPSFLPEMMRRIWHGLHWAPGRRPTPGNRSRTEGLPRR